MGHYQDAARVIGTSVWEAEQILKKDGVISLDKMQLLFDFVGIKVIEDNNSNPHYELSTEINNKIFKNYAGYWLERKRYEVRESTFANYSNLFVNNIIPCLGNIPCD